MTGMVLSVEPNKRLQRGLRLVGPNKNQRNKMITMTHASVLGSSNELVTGCTPIYLKDYSYSLWCVQLMIGEPSLVLQPKNCSPL